MLQEHLLTADHPLVGWLVGWLICLCLRCLLILLLTCVVLFTLVFMCMCQLQAGDRVMDMATGTADVAIMMSKELIKLDASATRQHPVIGIDPSANMLHVRFNPTVVTVEVAHIRYGASTALSPQNICLFALVFFSKTKDFFFFSLRSFVPLFACFFDSFVIYIYIYLVWFGLVRFPPSLPPFFFSFSFVCFWSYISPVLVPQIPVRSQSFDCSLHPCWKGA